MAIVVRKIGNPWVALGLAAHFTARNATFGRFPAGDLIRTLNGQIARGHYLFALDDASEPARVVGFFGWALYDHDVADAFAATGMPPDPGRGLASGGDVIWILTAAADSARAFFALVKAARAICPHHRVMGVRHREGRRVVFDQSRARVGARKDRKALP